MVYIKGEFKEMWDANDEETGIVWNDIADCSKAWDLYDSPRTHPMDKVIKAVVIAA